MSKKRTTIGIDQDDVKRLRILAKKSGYSINYMVRELSKLADYVPENADRITLGILPRPETRSILFVAMPVYTGSVEVDDSTLESGEDKAVHEDLVKKIDPEGKGLVDGAEVKLSDKTEKVKA